MYLPLNVEMVAGETYSAVAAETEGGFELAPSRPFQYNIGVYPAGGKSNS